MKAIDCPESNGGDSSDKQSPSDTAAAAKSRNTTDGGVPVKKQKGSSTKATNDDNAENSSTGSDGGKGGSGSRGGYSADCSSSDASSLEAVKGSVAELHLSNLSINGGRAEDKNTKTKDQKPSKSSKGSTAKTPKAARRSVDQADNSSHSLSMSKKEPSDDPGSVGGSSSHHYGNGLRQAYALPQWNGVRISHPMDPRIDLSTVNHIQTSSVTRLPTNVDVPSTRQQPPDDQSRSTDVVMGTAEALPPSIDQYMNLMEVVRPFFDAHGISPCFPRSDEPSNERPSSDFATEPSDSDHKPAADERKIEPVAAWNISKTAGVAAAAAASAHASYPTTGEQPDSDSSSMVVLARVKRKHLKKSPEDPTNDGSNTSFNEGSNGSSSSEKKVRIQQPQRADEELNNQEVAANEENEDLNENPNAEAADGADPQAEAAARQESTSTSSSEERGNNEDAPQVAPLRYGVPAVVSEYSSSARAGSSGASNTNLMSTSGSGSGGNTGSGTGSGTEKGSNQGGSSGSGNDQGGSYVKGDGNDVKGSSEETMDNSGENNSGENSGGNSDETNSNNDKNKATAAVAADSPHVSTGSRHGTNAPEAVQKPQPMTAHDSEDQNAAREKKLQDKKRKRMNMRREYEEKVQQEMESSEGSRGRGEVLLRPGRPVTLDKVLSFTKTARIVIKAGPPFLVVYTNAAYSRLSGIDSHAAVGKPIATLLSIPDQDLLAALDARNNNGASSTAQLENATVAVDKTADGNNGQQQEQTSLTPNFDTQNNGSNQNDADAVGGQTYVAAEAAGRARAAASEEDNTDMCLERLVAASGYGRCHIIHVVAKPHHMLGRNVAVLKAGSNGASASSKMRSNREEGSNRSSITSGYDGPYHLIPCSMGVSPVVSSPEAFNVAVVTDKDQDVHHHKTKRRKHHHHNIDSQQSSSANHHQHRRNFLMREVSMHRKRHLITHYVIQLEPFEGSVRKFGSLESHSSTSTTMEAHILGLTKSELRRQRMRTQAAPAPPQDATDQSREDEDDNEMESESSSEPKEPVTAIG